MTKKYSNKIRLAFAINAEKEILSKAQISTIPFATRNYWRNQNPEKYLDHDQKLNSYNLEISTGGAIKYLRLLQSLRKLGKVLIDQIGETEYLKILELEKESFVEFIETNNNHFTKQKLLLGFNVSSSKYGVWRSQVQYDCTSSRQYLCAKRHSQQLTEDEILSLQKLLSLEKMKHWPLSAVWAHGLRNQKLMISRSSFYRYNKIFQFRSKAQESFKKKYKPVRATKVNEIWHADLTYVQTDDGRWNYVYAIIDNYSKKVLAYRVEAEIRAAHSTDCLREALSNEQIESLEYMTDGGKEYDNQTIKSFLSSYNISVKHTVAKRDVKQSNSMIERLFHLIKKDYLNRQAIKNLSELKVVIEDVFDEYNNRPHYIHKYYSPKEVHKQSLHFNANKLLNKANTSRIKLNQNCPCTKCTCY
jgi:transposase InsO family protein